MTVGSFQVFKKIMTLICNLQVKVNVSLKTSISIFYVQTIYSSLESRYVRRVYVQNIEYNPSSLFEADTSHICHGFLEFHRFSQIFFFHILYIDFHRFLKIFIYLYRCSSIFIDLHRISSIFTDFTDFNVFLCIFHGFL